MMTSKIYITAFSIICALVCIQCNSTESAAKKQKVELSSPNFVNETIYFNSYTAGTKEGGTGYEIHLENFDLPENVKLNKVYFAGQSGDVYPTSIGYSARTKEMSTGKEDVIMSSDVNKEAANNVPSTTVKFPFPLTESQAGIQYTENGVVKYTIMNSVLQREPIYYPSAPPKEQNQ
ncbi:hypothetical protein [Dokdonia sp. Hel_I_53]|uniref:hypothetical protein n=1 Tax=Dokdonia sp. Hel_I_53 TaxID=1566287 RepID=UPI00119917BA|nr:hypothetical protein [Dokdonia sp. Hel_I_53]TVZ52732.1 hypothetical protein OD90_1916 [Dokdonia sp. Hel_I_53]